MFAMRYVNLRYKKTLMQQRKCSTEKTPESGKPSVRDDMLVDSVRELSRAMHARFDCIEASLIMMRTPPRTKEEIQRDLDYKRADESAKDMWLCIAIFAITTLVVAVRCSM